MQLSEIDLCRTEAFIGGEWTGSDSGETFPVHNPATGEKLAAVPRCGVAETRRAIAAAAEALPEWRARPAKDRSILLRRWHDLIIEHQRDLAHLITLEQGKPLAEARAEVLYAASFVEWYAEEAKRLYGEVIPHIRPHTRLMVITQPVGVTAGITPWNFPIAMITRKLAPALAAGNVQVVKPAEDTPLSALSLAELAVRAGFPRGIFSIVPGAREDAAAIGRELSTNPIIRKISFTGSTPVGKLLAEQAAGTVKKVSLELGGNAPFLVFNDADVDQAVAGAVASKFRNSGQTCVCANRILVQEDVFDAFHDKLCETVATMKVGDGQEEGVTISALINDRGLAKVERLVKSARTAGAKASVGGGPHERGGSFYQPSVMTNVTPDMEIANEEIFGPVAPLIRFRTEEEGVRLANDTPYGLAAYFYSRDVGRCWRVAEALETGGVGVNSGVLSTEATPHGGVKESGLGREGGHYGIEEWVEPKYLCMGDI